MGYLGYFYVETKSFEIRSNVEGAIQLAKKSRGKSQSVIMAWPTVLWLRRNNSHGNFLELPEYGGKGLRSFLIIPEVESLVGVSAREKSLGQMSGVHKAKSPVGVQARGSYAKAVVGVRNGEKQQSLEKATAGDLYSGTHTAGDGASKLVLEGVKDTDPVIAPGDHALQ
ncbi:hypothetical protein FH972_015077 [Carpinus fangiana]|uniref:Uncharacterized protein n=1 Tax=Carpinus fangiana TaxID=176857 RepID=A0A5N6RF89_9ROSI|nr:hypothetical protein FH972_015077 [Carpinus fangiana]